MTLLASLVEVSDRVGAASARLKKVRELADFMRTLDPAELPIGVLYLSGGVPQGRFGIGRKALRAADAVAAAGLPSLSLTDVDRKLGELATLGGKGGATRRGAALGELFSRATVSERRLLARLLLGDLRQGALAGVMAKALDAPYEAGSRGASWLKVKRAHTLDLVVIAAEWGHGRRTGKLSNLHLSALDTATGEYVMLGKTFKGLTDRMLQWQTHELLAREIRRDGITVYVRPELVAEIAFSDLQASPRYPGGLALRLARVKRYRPDKGPDRADTMASVRQIFESRRHLITRPESG